MPPVGLSLKQRLAALSTGQKSSGPSTPSPVSSRATGPISGTSTPVRKNLKDLFNQPWVKRNLSSTSVSSLHNLPDAFDQVEDVMSNLIFQAGVDYETRPMVVMNASALPDPRQVNYDVLLSRILQYLDLFVEADYTLVFFAAGSRYTPGWNWVWKAYRSLSRKYRKNLKRLIIVHSTFFTKMLFSLAGAIISPKFFQKIAYVDTLSDLAYLVPLTQIDIPPPVYQENLKHEQQIKLPVKMHTNVFGIALEELMGTGGEKGGVPRVVRDCVQYLRDSGMNEEGLFRRSPKSVILQQIQEAYDRGQVVSLNSYRDPNLAAVLIKKFFRDLPEPIFPQRLYPCIRKCPIPTNDADMAPILYIRDTLLPELPRCAYILLEFVIHLLHDIALRSSYNKMDASNLSIVFTPNLISSGNIMRDVSIASVGPPPILPNRTPLPSSDEGKATLGLIIKICIQRYFEVFDEVQDQTEAVSLSATLGGNQFDSSSGQEDDHDDDIDDEMLVMPIGPSHSASGMMGGMAGLSSSPPSAWAPPYKPRVRPKPANTGSGAARSTYTGGTKGTSGSNGTSSKTRSLLSIEKGSRSTIKVGTTRKTAGSNVTAVNVTASGFFVPPVPQTHNGNRGDS